MATDIDILEAHIQIRTQQYEVGLTPQKQISQKVDTQAVTLCSAQCPLCQQEGHTGACGLNAGHTQEHQCNRVSTHRWSESGPGIDVPGPH